MEFSPPKRLPKQLRGPSKDSAEKNADEEDTKPVLILKPFSAVPHVSFDKVKLGCVKTSVLYVFNPLEVDQVVRVEKFPTDKGFSIETGELYVKAGEENALNITWAPVKATSFRETVAFRSSSGCKNQAYLLGTAYSPVKKVQQRTSSSRSRTGGRKVFPERITTKNKDLKIHDEKKENLGEKELGKFEPRVSFCLKTIEELPDSPIRRQTYTINSMLRNADVLPFRPIQSNDNVKLPSQSRLSSNFNSLNNIKLSKEFMQFPPPLASTFHTEDNLNDSLENKIEPVFFTDLKGPSSEDRTPSISSTSFDTASVKDSVVTYDKESKHMYFGYTPKQPGKNSKLLENGNHKNTEFDCDLNQSVFYPPGQKQVPSVKISDFDANSGSNERKYENHNCHPLSSSSFAKQCVLLKNEPYRYSSQVGKDIAPVKNYELIKDWQSLNANSTGAHDFSETLESRGFEASNIEMTHDYEDMNLSQAFKLSAENSINKQPLKESKKAFFLEISCDSKNVSSDLPKKSKTNSTLSAHSLKKSQKSSPFKAKVLKSRMLSNKDGDKAASKAYAVLKNKEKKKFLPKKLSLSKPRMTDSIVYHRNPYASMNIYYDEHWIEKQEVAFTSWLNFILTPNEDCGSESFKVDSAKLWVESIKENSSAPAPTKEELSLKAYTAVKNLNMLRKLSSNLYQSEEVVAVIKKVEREVELKKLNIRPDRAIQADLGIKKDILEMLLSYNTLWLRIGLETIYGEVISLQNNSDVLGLSRFIVHRFLQSPDIASKYSHPAVINYYKKGYEDAIQRFILKKFLLLVFFLDVAKTKHLIKHNPCLFNKSAKYKSSRDLLLVFSREYLSGEGDITKHLRYLGYKVTYQQTALEEFDYSVRNIATDLRCGLRLGRVVELLLQDWTISERLRINTLNRLTKVHNNDVILKALKNASIEIENNIEAKHITDGDREKTLDLLWQIIFKTEISQLINTDLLKKENAFLLKNLKLRADFAAFEALRGSESVASSNELSILESKLYKENEILQLLFKWCQNVCAHYNIRVYNFTSSFSDGVALCILLHHYLPNVLPYASIKMETSRSYFEQQMIISENDDESCPFVLQNDQQNSLMEKLLKNERDNLSLVFQKFQEVGNIPVLCTPSNLSNTMPDEKVMVTLLSYINIRLLDLSIEIRAARVILHAWKKYKLRKYHQRLKIEIQAVRIIQRTWRRYIAKKTYETHYKAALKIQSFYRMHQAKKMLTELKHKASLEWQNQNAVVIQAAYRGYLLRKQIARYHKAATVIQSCFRRWYLRSKFVKLKNTVLKIQRYYRAKVIGRKQRLHYVNTQRCVVRLQAYARGMLARKHFKKQQLSAVKIQAYVRMWLEKRKYNRMRNACITIQRKFRGYLLTEFLREEYQNFRNAAILIQRWYRSACTQRHEKKCIVKTQACIRRYIARKKYLTSLKSAVKIQTWWRAVSIGRKTRLSYIQSCKSIICVQSFVRQFIAKRNYERQKKAAGVIQKHVRAFIIRRKFKKIRDVTVKIQRAWRLKTLARKTRSDYLQFRNKVIFAQSLIRRFIAVQNYKTKKCAAVIIQKNVRALIERKRFCLLKSNTIFIQRKWRATILARIARVNFLLYRHHVVFIQSLIRRQLAFHDFQRKKECAIVIQKFTRMFIARQNYLKLKKSVILIQNKWRSILLGRKVRKNFLACRKSAVKIQSYYRMHSCKQNFLKMKRSAIKIQRYYAAYKVMCAERQKYTVLKKGVIKFQALYRGWYVRKNLKTLNKKATVIQSFFRKWKQQSEYKKLRKACIVIQERYQAKLEMRKCYNDFIKMKTAAIKIQAMFRCHIIHKQFKHLKSSVIKIQSCFRMIKCYKAYCRTKKAAVVIQRYFRLYKLTRETRRDYLQKRSGLIMLQSKVRAMICRRRFLKEKKACIFIQSLIRMNIQRRKYLQKRNAAVQIQRYFKNWCLMKSDKDKYNQLRKSVIFLQSKVRAKIVRRRFLNQKRACILIQSYSRMHAKRKKYVKIRRAVICIQRFYRNQKIMQVQQNIYIQQRQSVIFLQSKVRSVLARKRYLKQKKACTLIQSIVRMYLQRKMYLKFQQASVVLQKNYRSWKLMQLQRSKYLQMRKATIVLQSALRSARARREYLKIKHSCIKIQALFRMLICRNKFIKSKRAATLIQTYFRHWRLMKIQQNSYIKTKKSLIVLQSKVRSWLARKKFMKTKESCVLLQSYFRMYVQKTKYCKLREATIILQRFYRNRQIAKVHRDNFLKMKKTTIFMQSRVRCALARKKYLKQKKACITIQSFARMLIQRTQYNRTLKAVLVIQRWFKNYKISSEIRAGYLSLQRSCIILQSYVRMHKYRMQFIRLRASAVFIQRKYRAILLARKVRQNYLNQKEACIRLQSYVRMVIAVQKFKKLRFATITLQSQFRGYKARKEYSRIRKAVIALQTYFKSWMMSKKDRNNFLQLKSSATAIQSAVRGYFARKNFKLQVKACVMIQAYVRGYICRKKYIEKRNATVTLQKHIKAYICAKRAREEYVHKKKCIIITQAVVRGYLTRCHVGKLHYSATKIQAAYRTYTIRRHYIRQKESAIIIQKHFRALLLMKMTQKKYAKLKYSAILIQSAFRKYKERKEYLRTRAAVILLQAHFRKLIVRSRFVKLKNSVCVIENYYLSYKMRLHEQNAYQVKKASCIKIQALWRGYMARKKLRTMIVAASKIQKAFRSWRERNMCMSMKTLILNKMNLPRFEHLWYLCLRRSTIDFQRAARAYLLRRNKAVLTIQSWVKMWIARKQFRKLKAALKIQACWRGYCVRRSISDKKVTEARCRIRAADGAEANKLKNRTTHSLETLWCNEGKVDVGRLLAALKDLDVCTRLSPRCCERLVAADGHTFLIDLIKRCNRSIAHMEIIKMTVNILLNLAKYNKTAESIWSEKKTLSMMTQLMIKHRQNGEAIFSKCCSLLWIFSQDPQKAEVMKEDVKFMEQIISFHTLCTRSLTNQKRSLLSKDIAARSLKSSDQKKLALGKTSLIDPDWILGQNRQREFANPELAITMLFRSLNPN